MLQKNKVLLLSILLFSFLAIPIYAISQDNCGRMRNRRGLRSMFGMQHKDNHTCMMNNRSNSWSQSNHNSNCPWWGYNDYKITDMTKIEAGRWFDDYLFHYQNPNLKIGKIKETDDYFEAEIVTKDNSLVEKITLDKNTGWMNSQH